MLKLLTETESSAFYFFQPPWFFHETERSPVVKLHPLNVSNMIAIHKGTFMGCRNGHKQRLSPRTPKRHKGHVKKNITLRIIQPIVKHMIPPCLYWSVSNLTLVSWMYQAGVTDSPTLLSSGGFSQSFSSSYIYQTHHTTFIPKTQTETNLHICFSPW